MLPGILAEIAIDRFTYIYCNGLHTRGLPYDKWFGSASSFGKQVYSGKPLFGKIKNHHGLKLVDTRLYPSVALFLLYEAKCHLSETAPCFFGNHTGPFCLGSLWIVAPTDSAARAVSVWRRHCSKRLGGIHASEPARSVPPEQGSKGRGASICMEKGLGGAD